MADDMSAQEKPFLSVQTYDALPEEDPEIGPQEAEAEKNAPAAKESEAEKDNAAATEQDNHISKDQLKQMQFSWIQLGLFLILSVVILLICVIVTPIFAISLPLVFVCICFFGEAWMAPVSCWCFIVMSIFPFLIIGPMVFFWMGQLNYINAFDITVNTKATREACTMGIRWGESSASLNFPSPRQLPYVFEECFTEIAQTYCAWQLFPLSWPDPAYACVDVDGTAFLSHNSSISSTSTSSGTQRLPLRDPHGAEERMHTKASLCQYHFQPPGILWQDYFVFAPGRYCLEYNASHVCYWTLTNLWNRIRFDDDGITCVPIQDTAVAIQLNFFPLPHRTYGNASMEHMMKRWGLHPSSRKDIIEGSRELLNRNTCISSKRDRLRQKYGYIHLSFANLDFGDIVGFGETVKDSCMISVLEIYFTPLWYLACAWCIFCHTKGKSLRYIDNKHMLYKQGGDDRDPKKQEEISIDILKRQYLTPENYFKTQEHKKDQSTNSGQHSFDLFEKLLTSQDPYQSLWDLNLFDKDGGDERRLGCLAAFVSCMRLLIAPLYRACHGLPLLGLGFGPILGQITTSALMTFVLYRFLEVFFELVTTLMRLELMTTMVRDGWAPSRTGRFLVPGGMTYANYAIHLVPGLTGGMSDKHEYSKGLIFWMSIRDALKMDAISQKLQAEGMMVLQILLVAAYGGTAFVAALMQKSHDAFFNSLLIEAAFMVLVLLICLFAFLDVCIKLNDKFSAQSDILVECKEVFMKNRLRIDHRSDQMNSKESEMLVTFMKSRSRRGNEARAYPGLLFTSKSSHESPKNFPESPKSAARGEFDDIVKYCHLIDTMIKKLELTDVPITLLTIEVNSALRARIVFLGVGVIAPMLTERAKSFAQLYVSSFMQRQRMQ